MKINKSLPTIVLAHHDVGRLVGSHQTRIRRILPEINTRVYLCGDKHQLDKLGIEKYGVDNTIPCIVCGKAAVEPNDQYSDVNIIFYNLEDDGKAYVHVYKWNKRKFNFVTCSELDEEIDTPYSFYMINRSRTTKQKDILTSLSENQPIKESAKPTSIWLPDAEYATGKQTRFNSFTCTETINRYFDEQAGLLGVISVKGIGKTFVLQVKRVRSARKYWCLPVCSKPSVDNHWATERVSFQTYAALKTQNPYDDLVMLWKFAIRCYIINYLTDTNDNEKTLLEYFDKEKISDLTFSLCKHIHNRSLESILRNVINTPKWDQAIREDETEVHNICDMFLRRRIDKSANAKKIAIFIDKVDQAVK